MVQALQGTTRETELAVEPRGERTNDSRSRERPVQRARVGDSTRNAYCVKTKRAPIGVVPRKIEPFVPVGGEGFLFSSAMLLGPERK